MRPASLLAFALIAGCASPPPGEERVSIHVEGMVRSQGLTWLGWPNKVQAALEALPGIRQLDVVLEHDRFDVAFDPAQVSMDRMLEAVRGLGFEATVVATPAPESAPVERPRTELTGVARDALAEASRTGRLVLLDFTGPGWVTCEEMDAVTYPDALVKSELSRWVFARIDISKESGTAKSLDVRGVPAALAMSADGTVLARLEGFFTPDAFARELRAIQEARAAK